MNTDAPLLEMLCRSGFEPPATNYYCTPLTNLMMQIDHAVSGLFYLAGITSHRDNLTSDKR